ncbi:hypothetical protein JD79_00959 [Geodermatophilus normandii]|uniref:Uncharacterized protein n=1 Tax=Geodermatophilus normandii TaxID=1137989 RepID=A0A317QDM0_9ACTN|nr:hypothetical protein [Geodermatophilus normandii]PWW21818.1 hypothetical protein JD79_00959 [Geodermatophilus normandii]
MLIAVICAAWLALGLPFALALGRALRHADAADRARLPALEVRFRELRSVAGAGAGAAR